MERAERGLKKAYYPDYVLSQMTLDEELKTFDKKKVVISDETNSMFKEVKKPSGSVRTAKQIQQQLRKSKLSAAVRSDNLFSSDAGEDLHPVSPIEGQGSKKRFKKQ